MSDKIGRVVLAVQQNRARVIPPPFLLAFPYPILQTMRWTVLVGFCNCLVNIVVSAYTTSTTELWICTVSSQVSVDLFPPEDNGKYENNTSTEPVSTIVIVLIFIRISLTICISHANIYRKCYVVIQTGINSCVHTYLLYTRRLYI